MIEFVNKRRYQVVLYATVVVGCLFLMLLFGVKDFEYGDAWDYWERGQSLWQEGKFSLAYQRDGMRGYVFPLFLGICNQYLGGVIGWKIVNSLIVGVIFAVYLPKLIGIEINSRMTCIAGITSYALFSIFYYGLQTYVLSDLFAIFISLSTYLLIKKVTESKKMKLCFSYALLFGAGLYAMYNIRTIYMFAAMYLICVLFFSLYRSKCMLKNVISLLGSGVGFLATALPQMFMNFKYLGMKSLLVPTDNLMLRQLEWGIRYQRYETYIGTQQDMPQMYFIDDMGNKILQAEGLLETGITSWGEYFRLLLRYPLEMLGIYTRHILNMLLPAWPNQYVLNLENCKIIAAVLSFTCIYIFCMAFLLDSMKRKINIVNFIPILIPVVFIMPGAVESRFFAALFLLIIAKICYDIDWIKLWSYIKKNWIKAVFTYLISFCILIAVWGTMFASEGAYSIFWS